MTTSKPRPKRSLSDLSPIIEGSKGRIVLATEDGEAELTFSIASPKLIIVDHTGVPDGLRGQGAGARLAQAVVDYAMENGIKIVPLCPFFSQQRRSHPEWASVF